MKPINCIDCGKPISINATRCKSCANRITSSTHGESKTRIYSIWAGMLSRCYDSSNASYKFYGAKGITVCQEWKDSFLVFKEWALNSCYSAELTLDRIDSLSLYAPLNCRWSTAEVQYTNRRIMCTNTSGYKGVGKEKGKPNWYARIALNGKRVRLGCYKTAEEAAIAYNNYIIANNLPHNLNVIL